MGLRTIIACLLCALPVAGAPQGLEGLDLSVPRKRSEPAPRPPAEDDELPPLPGEAAPARPAAAPAAGPKAERDMPVIAEGDVALGDRVKAVQRKGFLKRHRFEIAPLFATTVNDAFYQKLGGGLRLAYSFQDSFALAARGAYYTPYRTDNVKEGKIAFSSQLLNSQLYGQLMIDGVWSPIYGKAAWLDRSIVHFDLFLAAGFGAVWSATSFDSAEKAGRGPHIAAEVGGGLRFYPLEWLAFELGMMVTLYPDQPVETLPGTVQKIFAANVGVSFFLPPSFEYVYP